MLMALKLLLVHSMIGQLQVTFSQNLLESRFFYKRMIFEDGPFLIMSAVNAASNQVNTTADTRSLNIVDGVVLTEAIRYAILSTRRYQQMVSYLIMDIGDSPIPFHEYYHVPFLSAVSSRQVSSYIFLRQLYQTPPAPFVSALPFNTVEEDLSKGNGKGPRSNFAAVPPSRFEVEAIIDILSSLDWKFVTVIVSRDESGQKKIQEFTNSAFKRGICVGRTVWMSTTATVYEISKAVNELKQVNNATVIVSFVEATQIRGILQSDLRGLNFITGTNFRVSRNEVNFKKNTAKGMLILQHDDTYDENFKNYFMNLQLISNKYSWFGEFWSEIFQCTIPLKLRSEFGTYKNYSKDCTGREKLSEDLVDIRYALVKPVLNSIPTMLCALIESYLRRTCFPSLQPNIPMYGTKCGGYIMMNSSYYFGNQGCQLSGTGQFNNDGYISRKYLILNYNGTDYNEVGNWYYNETMKRGTLNLSQGSISWNLGSHQTTSCYTQCIKGEVEDRGSDGKLCCYKCRKCSSFNEIVQNNTCIKCQKFEVPAPSRNSCLPLPRIFIGSNKTPYLALVVIAIIGIALTIAIIGTFVKYKNSSAVKSTGRHLSIVMMISVVISLCTVNIFFLRPTATVCSIQKILLGQCLSAFYIPMLLKTIQIYRIFEASKNFIRNPALVSTKSQMIICLLGVLANLILGVLLAASQPTAVKEKEVEAFTKVAVLCNHDPVDAVTSLVPCLLLLFACTYFGYKSRHFPSNFNESFRISITLYISCFLWGVYIPLLYLFQSRGQNAFMTNFITAALMIILAFVNLIGIFATTLVKAIEKRKVEPVILVGSSTFAATLTENSTGVTKEYKDIGLDPIEF